MVLVLLPPSEGKTSPVAGDPVDLATLGATSLTRHRQRVLRALVRVSGRRDALTILRVGASLAEDVAANRALLTAPTARAHLVYTGVLYGGARLDDLPDDAARDRAQRCVRTVSALWGLVAPEDRIPAYRLSMYTDLPGIGPLARSWRGPLAQVLDPLAAEQVVVDCRSASYAAAWPVPVTGPGHLAVRVLTETDGRRIVVSHWAKHARGLLTRHLLTREGPEPTDPAGVLGAATEMVGTGLVDATLDPAPGGRYVLSLVTR